MFTKLGKDEKECIREGIKNLDFSKSKTYFKAMLKALNKLAAEDYYTGDKFNITVDYPMNPPYKNIVGGFYKGRGFAAIKDVETGEILVCQYPVDKRDKTDIILMMAHYYEMCPMMEGHYAIEEHERVLKALIDELSSIFVDEMDMLKETTLRDNTSELQINAIAGELSEIIRDFVDYCCDEKLDNELVASGRPDITFDIWKKTENSIDNYENLFDTGYRDLFMANDTYVRFAYGKRYFEVSRKGFCTECEIKPNMNITIPDSENYIYLSAYDKKKDIYGVKCYFFDYSKIDYFDKPEVLVADVFFALLGRALAHFAEDQMSKLGAIEQILDILKSVREGMDDDTEHDV